jgi:hypothetical protein
MAASVLMHAVVSSKTWIDGMLAGFFRSILVYLLLDLVAYFYNVIRRQRVRAAEFSSRKQEFDKR